MCKMSAESGWTQVEQVMPGSAVSCWPRRLVECNVKGMKNALCSASVYQSFAPTNATSICPGRG